MKWNTLEWQNGFLKILDQTLLPAEVKYITADRYETVVEAIRRLQVRGAPAIGVAAAFGVVLGANQFRRSLNFEDRVKQVIHELAATRPTAVNLFWALDRQKKVLEVSSGQDPEQILLRLEAEAQKIATEDAEVNRKIGEHGAVLLSSGMTVLTHCNAGALATYAYGTALAVIRVAVEQGKQIAVYADETRPLLQGARLTAWELMQENIPVTLITDNMAASVMRMGKIQAVIVGADRIAANGDVANKIGTYGVAVLAMEHGIPFYVAAPLSTIDISLKSGEEIPIEERAASEVTSFGGTSIAPAGVKIYNPAFDMTPARFVSGIITERGVATGDWQNTLGNWKRSTV